MVRLYCLLIGYLFGLFQTAYLYGRLRGIDIRNYGSGNAGTTNMLRTLGTRSGIIVLAGDMLKTVLAMWVTALIFGESHPDQIYLLKMWAAIGCIIGHNYPFYMKFHGGKGVAVTAGFLCGFHWSYIPVGFLSFMIPWLSTHFVSLGSLCMVTVFYIQLIVMGQFGGYGAASAGTRLEMYLLGALITGLCWFQHRGNLERLRNGSERKTYLGRRNHAALSGEDLEKLKNERRKKGK